MGIFDILKPKDKIVQQVTDSKKILIVEDDATLSNALQEKFKLEGFDVVTAANGEEGLSKLTSFKPNLVILDLLMPIMDGKTMLAKLRVMEEFKLLPVIILTNQGGIENITETVRYNNANAFLVKSNTSTEEIVSKVRTLLY
jgi:DNA-binding response OmpR family regulator